MMIAAMKAFSCLSLFAFLGVHARTLPSLPSPHIKTSAYHEWISIFATLGMTPAEPTNPSSHIKPANLYDLIQRPQKSAPPPPFVAPPHSEANAYHEWNSIFPIHGRTLADLSYPSPQVGPERHGGGLMSSNYVTTSLPREEITKRPKSLAPPPPPRVAPPQVETSAYCATGSLCSQSVRAI
ncbi:hypothetical protein POM88_044540 [Heracleum sosnowskyi]|uniref:Uncharacterized protein n=1 Tax=Heracleum sosnowskyi TaxID=360622 RepID=A0AAD8H484_9APIA|nr:hypothetical protein POM88_044540 [Heracleum sosnowskyi]